MPRCGNAFSEWSAWHYFCCNFSQRQFCFIWHAVCFQWWSGMYNIRKEENFRGSSPSQHRPPPHFATNVTHEDLPTLKEQKAVGCGKETTLYKLHSTYELKVPFFIQLLHFSGWFCLFLASTPWILSSRMTNQLFIATMKLA